MHAFPRREQLLPRGDNIIRPEPISSPKYLGGGCSVACSLGTALVQGSRRALFANSGGRQVFYPLDVIHRTAYSGRYHSYTPRDPPAAHTRTRGSSDGFILCHRSQLHFSIVWNSRHHATDPPMPSVCSEAPAYFLIAPALYSCQVPAVQGGYHPLTHAKLALP